jgi:hypothetical protein
VPAGYLRAWASENGNIMVGWTDGRPTQPLNPKSVGVRSGFYRVERADGSFDEQLEPAMGTLENKALTIIRSIEERWPLAGPDRGLLAEYMALQLMRGPSWRDWYATAHITAGQVVRQQDPERSADVLAAAADRLATDEQRHRLLVESLGVLGTLFANMHWTLLRCGAPRLATSDHPLVPVAFTTAPRSPVSAVPYTGTLETSEYRLALSPWLLLLMTWLDDHGPEPVSKLDIRHVRNHNAVVISQADVQWFHHPTRAPDRTPPPWQPIAIQLFGDDYHPHSQRREHVQHSIDEMLAADEINIRLIEWGVPRQLPARPRDVRD